MGEGDHLQYWYCPTGVDTLEEAGTTLKNGGGQFGNVRDMAFLMALA